MRHPEEQERLRRYDHFLDYALPLYVQEGTSPLSFFFFKQETAYDMVILDWSSDVCSSDLLATPEHRTGR